MSKRIIIVHGWGHNPKSAWFPWAKKELEKQGYEVLVPAMPDPDFPKIEPWISVLAKVVGAVGGDTILVGHSVGCQAILRFLETLPENQKAGKVILIAPWFSLLPEAIEDEDDEKVADPWLRTLLDWEKVKEKADSFVAIFSDNDPFVPLEENKNLFEDKLEAEVIVKLSQGHFNEAAEVKELPILLEYI